MIDFHNTANKISAGGKARAGTAAVSIYQLSSSDGPRGRGFDRPDPEDLSASEREDLPYRVEVWDQAESHVEHLLAVTASASIGYAAFYAATKEYPTRLITLRHNAGIISRWNGPAH